MKYFIALITCCFCLQMSLFAQSYEDRYKSLDIKHYDLFLQVNDTTDQIDATMKIKLRFRKTVSEFNLDLVSLDSITGKGMVVDSIFQNNVTVAYKHDADNINITPKHPFLGITYTYTIKYHGIPKDGLVIGENIHGDRTFFGDNWPNRAHHWFPSVDHPSDKAIFEAHVIAPNHYQVIANGDLIEETNLTEKLKLSHWKTRVPLPTKVMVVGIAKFAVQQLGETNNIPVSTWVYPQTKEEGFFDFGNAKNILDFFIENIGEYPYSKLANVQSKTRFGGMENAGNIFYFERSVNGKRQVEELIAHEIAHQWFGNSASEIDWPHVWLSEGFATYFTDLYVLETKGEDAFREKMQKERTTVLKFYKRSPTPVVDLKTKNYMRLLNANSYQKGAWVLHMLRKKIGDQNFYDGVKKYYQKYQFSNASTDDFRKVMESQSGMDLTEFFDQWLFKTGQPKLKTNWIYHDNKVRLMVDQLQEQPFVFLLDLEFTLKDGSTEIKTIEVSAKSAPFVIPSSGEVKKVTLDPHSWLLFETEEE